MVDLHGCPAREHVEWWLRAISAGAPPVTVDALLQHSVAPDGITPEGLAGILATLAAGGQAVTEVRGWRRSAFADAVITYQGADTRDYDLVVDVEPDSGKLLLARTMRSARGADVGYKDPAELTPGERAEVHRVFGAAFREPDHEYLERTLARMSSIGLGFSDDRLLGFCLCTQAGLELPGLGWRIFNDAGLTCVDPESRLGGLSNAIGHMALAGMKVIGPSDFAMLHFSTPIAVRASLRFTSGPTDWPGSDIHRWLANYRKPPTANQRAAGRAIADYLGAADYDEEHWVVIGTGHPIESTAAPDLEKEYFELFEHVDTARGDQLLALFWGVAPPQWWQ